MFTYNKLRGRIVEKYGTMARFAEDAGLSVQALSKKMNSKTSFNQADIVKWCELLDIPAKEIGAYFFT